jgi:hypothetical protein
VAAEGRAHALLETATASIAVAVALRWPRFRSRPRPAPGPHACAGDTAAAPPANGRGQKEMKN